MGLDTYFYSTDRKLATQVDFDRSKEDELIIDMRYHHDLNDWMRKLYKEKGGQDRLFNTEATMVLTEADLVRLEKDLPEIAEKFREQVEGTSEEMGVLDNYKYWVSLCREAMAEGKTVYYQPWW
jgi:hypothetical protein